MQLEQFLPHAPLFAKMVDTVLALISALVSLGGMVRIAQYQNVLASVQIASFVLPPRHASVYLVLKAKTALSQLVYNPVTTEFVQRQTRANVT